MQFPAVLAAFPSTQLLPRWCRVQMHAFQQEVPIADNRAICCVSSPIDDHLLPDRVVIPDFLKGIFSLKLEILRSGPDNGSLIDRVVCTHACTAQNAGIRHDCAVIPDLDVLVDIGERMDSYILSYFCIGINVS